MKLQTHSLEKALGQLRKSLACLQSSSAKKDPALYEQFRAATIHMFEYSYELTVKMIRRQLSEIVPIPQSLAHLTFADLLRAAADAGLIQDVKRFLVYRDARNQTSHTYDEKTADEVAQPIPDFFRDASFVLDQIKKRNP